MRSAGWSLLAVGLLVAGCTLVAQPGPKDVSGPTDGYQPTSSYLKVFVRSPDGNLTLVDFDRRDWYAAKIADKLDDKTIDFVTVHGQERGILGEIVVDAAKSPAELAALRYDAMHSTAQQQSAMDLEYEHLLQKLSARTPASTPSTPAVALPNV